MKKIVRILLTAFLCGMLLLTAAVTLRPRSAAADSGSDAYPTPDPDDSWNNVQSWEEAKNKLMDDIDRQFQEDKERKLQGTGNTIVKSLHANEAAHSTGLWIDGTRIRNIVVIALAAGGILYLCVFRRIIRKRRNTKMVTRA